MLPLERLVATATHVDQDLRGGEFFVINADLIYARKIGGVETIDRPFMQVSLALLKGKRADWLIILCWGRC